MKNAQIPVAREGFPFIAFVAFVTLIFAELNYDFMTLLALGLTGFVVYFFRDPERIAPDAEDAIVAPADGKIILVEKIFDDRFVNDHVYKISIFMSVFNVHVNRMPYTGVVERIQYVPGSFYSANTDQGGLANEHCGVILTTEKNFRYAVVQVAGLIARRIVSWVEKGDTVARGSRFGMIRFGSRVDLYIPQQVQLEVRSGQIVRAGETVIGYIA